MANIKREPGDIEIYDEKLKKWIPNPTVCYVSDEILCALPGCNRKPRKWSRQNSINKRINGKRYCSHSHAAMARLGVDLNDQEECNIICR